VRGINICWAFATGRFCARFFPLLSLWLFTTGHVGVECVILEQSLTLISLPHMEHISISQRKIQKGQVPSPRSHSCKVTGPGLGQNLPLPEEGSSPCQSAYPNQMGSWLRNSDAGDGPKSSARGGPVPTPGTMLMGLRARPPTFTRRNNCFSASPSSPKSSEVWELIESGLLRHLLKMQIPNPTESESLGMEAGTHYF
jgi:hypothetical protein